ncbi:MAG: carboxypeptidase-like regulatory domain-containing protein [Chthoniobacter sp.]|nr:carboxypeptidase-like regulatory domain-containing protein [Chthoniobacter sp.]
MPSLALLAATAVLFSACASHEVPFNEADFTRSAGTGTGTVDGQVFRISADDSTWIQKHGSTVKLLPANAYTDEIVQRKYANRVHLMRPDSRMAKYVRKVRTDENGNFVFRHVPAGNYYVACHYKWTYPTDGTDADGNYEEVQASEDQWIYAHAQVISGKTTTVVGWDQGR